MLPQPQTKRPQTKRPQTMGKTFWGQVIGMLVLLLAIIGGGSYGAFVVASSFDWLAHPETRLAAFLLGASVGELAALGVLTWRLRRRGSSLRALGLGKATTWRGMALGLVVAPRLQRAHRSAQPCGRPQSAAAYLLEGAGSLRRAGSGAGGGDHLPRVFDDQPQRPGSWARDTVAREWGHLRSTPLAVPPASWRPWGPRWCWARRWRWCISWAVAVSRRSSSAPAGGHDHRAVAVTRILHGH